MQTYDCTVRLAGNVLNEVRKEGVSAPELIMYRAIHGDDGVVDIEKRKSDKRDHAEERARLIRIFGAKMVVKVFGDTYGAELPVKVEDVDKALVAQAKAEKTATEEKGE